MSPSCNTCRKQDTCKDFQTQLAYEPFQNGSDEIRKNWRQRMRLLASECGQYEPKEPTAKKHLTMPEKSPILKKETEVRCECGKLLAIRTNQMFELKSTHYHLTVAFPFGQITCRCGKVYLMNPFRADYDFSEEH